MHRIRKIWLAAAVNVTVLPMAGVLWAAEAAEGEGGGGLAAVVMQYVKTAGFALIAFAIVLWIIWKKLFPPIIEALDRRERTIRESLEAAEKAREEARKMIAEHEESLEKARAQARAIIEEGKADAERVKAGIVESARKEAEELSQRARRDIEMAKKAAVDDLYRQAARLSFEIAEKVIEKSLKPEDHQRLVDECIQKYEQEAV